MDKALNYLSLARKAGKIELREEPVGAAARAQHARLVVVAGNASDHTWRRAKSYVAGTGQECIRLPYSKDELGQATGRSSLAIAAFTDPAMALAFVKALEGEHTELIETLQRQVDRIRKRRDEEKAHQKNIRQGKKKAHKS